LFGVYDNFPDISHGIIGLSSPTSTERLQRAIVQSLHRANRSRKELDFPEFARHNIKAALEFGIAEGVTFSYIDDEILGCCHERLGEQPFPALDLLCIVRYYVTEEKRRRPLKFDYYMLRFLFQEAEVELHIYHERGTRRLSIEDLTGFLTGGINQELARSGSKPLKMTHMRVL